MMGAVLKVTISLLVMPNCLAVGQTEQFFYDTAPSDYYARSTTRDCPDRFYSNVHEFYEGSLLTAFGGYRSLRGEFKHMVAIGWTLSEEPIAYLCGGSLITSDFVLTAAHCQVNFENIPPDTVRIGDTDLESPEDDEYAQQIAIARFIAHPQYLRYRKYFDIAIVQLQRPAQFSPAVCNACLWLEEELPPGRMDAIGFGATGFGEALSPTLQRVELDSIDMTDCARRIAVNRRQMPDGFRDDQFCAASSTMDTCEGDSGGPIGVKRFDVRGAVIPLVVGVVSFGAPCMAGSTGVYTHVRPFVDWIEQTTNRSFDYAECTRSSFCGSRNLRFIPENAGDNYALSRFGLLWDEADTFSLYECGATLIDYQYLITLASCVTSSKGHPNFVVHGNEARVSVADVYVSPRYSPGSPGNNIALLKIAKFVNPNVFRPACLWNGNIDGQWNDTVNFSAYKPAVSNGSRTPRLQKGTMFAPDGESKKCSLQVVTNVSDVVCVTNSVQLVPSLCKMDHGGPVINSDFGRGAVFAYGLVSSLSDDCESNLYMTDVAPHLEWMESIIISQRHLFHIFSD